MNSVLRVQHPGLLFLHPVVPNVGDIVTPVEAVLIELEHRVSVARLGWSYDELSFNDGRRACALRISVRGVRIHKFKRGFCQMVNQHELDFVKETSSAPHEMEVQEYCHMKESPAKCTRLSALTAATSAKCHSNRIRADQSIAGNVGQREEAAARVVEEDIRS
jgi:hypothetical protein